MDVPDINSEKPTHKDNFVQSVNLFEKSFKEWNTSQIDTQKSEYEKIMMQSLSIMQESASQMINDKLVKMKEKLAQDVTSHIESPSDTSEKQVQSDIDSLKRSA